MKKFLLGMALSIAAFNNANAAPTVLSGALTSQTLSGCYFLDGCVTIPNGVVVRVNAGTIFLGSTTVGAEGALIVERGGIILATGTANNPIIFTSAEAPGNRRPGDWGGIIIAGRATNNRPGGTFTVEGPCAPIIAGGNNDDDSSGVFHYVQIHYAGISVGGQGTGNEINSLTLAAVGRKTVIHHIQIAYANDDAFEWFGGTVNTKYLIAYNTRDDDFDTDFGFRGLSQFGVALRLDTSMHDISGSNGIESDNNPDAPNFVGTPQTRPIFSNYSLIGPNVCNNFTVNPEFRSGAHIRRNSAHTLYNSYIAGWSLSGLFVQDNSTIGNTASGLLNWSSVTFANTTNLINSPAWAGCGSSMFDWLFGTTPPSCETGNKAQISIVGVGGLCAGPCGTPDFTMTGSTAQNGAPSFTTGTALTDLSSSFFDKTAQGVVYRGAFGSAATDWTVGWTNWCPQTTIYSCAVEKPAKAKNPDLILVPNPSSNITYAVFEATATGNVKISILDKVTGAAIRVINAQITKTGTQHFTFNVAGLQPGVYTVRAETSKNVFAGQLMVK